MLNCEFMFIHQLDNRISLSCYYLPFQLRIGEKTIKFYCQFCRVFPHSNQKKRIEKRFILNTMERWVHYSKSNQRKSLTMQNEIYDSRNSRIKWNLNSIEWYYLFVEHDVIRAIFLIQIKREKKKETFTYVHTTTVRCSFYFLVKKKMIANDRI